MKARISFMFLLVVVLLVQARLWAQSDTTLLTTTDFDCTWKLDGKAQGTLKADDSTVVPLSLGKHLVQATSTDGLHEWKAVVTISQAGQEMVEFKLKETHQRRVAETEQTTQPTTERTTQPREDPTWSDPATGLMWAGKDNGSNVTWNQAGSYCSNLRLAGYSNWRLPTIDELAGINDETQDVNGWHIKGGIRVSGWEWTNSAGNTSGEHRLFTFHNVKKGSILIVYNKRALCVRRSTE